VELPNLIDLDDCSMSAVSLPPSLSINSPLDTPSRIAKQAVEHAIEQPSEQLTTTTTTTLASSLRQGQSDVEKLAKVPNNADTTTANQVSERQKSGDTVLDADVRPTKTVVGSSATTPSQSMSSGLINGPKASRTNDTSFEATNREPSIAKLSAAMRPGGKRDSKSSRPQQRRNPRPRKLAERPAASPTGGLVSFQRGTGRKPKEDNSPSALSSKGPKRGGIQGEAKGKALQLEIMQQQSAAHVKERFSNRAAPNDV
jgi:hypothetical protein